MHRVFGYTANRCAALESGCDPEHDFERLPDGPAGTASAPLDPGNMTERETKSRAVKILAKSIYRDLEAQGFDEKQIVSLATELISEVTSRMARTDKAQQLA